MRGPRGIRYFPPVLYIWKKNCLSLIRGKISPKISSISRLSSLKTNVIEVKWGTRGYKYSSIHPLTSVDYLQKRDLLTCPHTWFPLHFRAGNLFENAATCWIWAIYRCYTKRYFLLIRTLLVFWVQSTTYISNKSTETSFNASGVQRWYFNERIIYVRTRV